MKKHLKTPSGVRDLRFCREDLVAGRSVVLDARFRRAEERRRATEVAGAFGAGTWIVEMVLDESTVKTRLDRRVHLGYSTSNARWTTYQQQKNEWKPVSEAPASRYIRLDASGPLHETLMQLLYRLYTTSLKQERRV